VKIVAILQTYNEQRFVGCCLDHLAAQGIHVYLVDNESTDETVAIAERWLTQNLTGIETLRRDGCYSQRAQLARKEQLAQTLQADWFIHVDADELRVSPHPRRSLADAIAEIDEAGFNAINFLEFTFVPTREHPDHDHPEFARTMRSYYPFLPQFPFRLNAWKRRDGPVDLSSSGGHVIRFPGLRMAPESLYSRHYLFLSLPQLASKYASRRYDADEVAAGWHRVRAQVDPSDIQLPSESQLRTYVADHLLDPSEPRKRELIDPLSTRRERAGRSRRLLRGALRRGRRGVRTLRGAVSQDRRSPTAPRDLDRDTR
jgi:glycosyltransferase involved in cell wall biosynthesis